jgi:hypothetical protein
MGYPVYLIAPTDAYHNSSLGPVPMAPNLLATPVQAAWIALLIQSVYPEKQFLIGVDPGTDFDPWIYPPDENRRVEVLYVADGSLNALYVGPMIQQMYQNGKGAPGAWQLVPTIDPGAAPGSTFPPHLEWVSTATPPPPAAITPSTAALMQVNVLAMLTAMQQQLDQLTAKLG